MATLRLIPEIEEYHPVNPVHPVKALLAGRSRLN
jgi:hypothetical protein